jgi:hypothetical protein
MFVEELLTVRWGEVEEEEDRESPIQAILSLPIAVLTEVLSLVKSGSRDEVLSSITQRLQSED